MAATLKITVSSQALVFEKTKVRQALRAAGAEVADFAKHYVMTSAGSGRFYYAQGAGRYRASAPGQSPVRRTGQLASSFVVKATGDTVSIRDTRFYAKFLETGATGGGFLKGGGFGKRKGKHRRGNIAAGARRLQPRPFISKAMDDRRSSIEQRLVAAINGGLKFDRVKPAKP